MLRMVMSVMLTPGVGMPVGPPLTAKYQQGFVIYSSNVQAKVAVTHGSPVECRSDGVCI
jgi:hypothetical protein